MRTLSFLIEAAILAVAVCSGLSCSPGESANTPADPATPAGAPRVVSLSPENGATAVASGTVDAVITFDQPMDGGMSLTTRGGPDKFPKMDNPRWSADRKTLTATMQLAPNREYVVGVNCPPYTNFKNDNGVSADAVVWTFTTGA